QRFVERALIVGSVTEEGDDHLSGLHLLGGEGCTHCDRNATRNDAVGPEIAFGNVGYVHGTATALAIACRLAEELGKHPLHIRALGDAVAVAAMGGGDLVGIG